MGETPPDFDLLADLTPPQRDAVLCTEGPLLVLAGPGSGKTRVITRRIAHLVSMGVPAWQILAVTFTNKAAGEMKHRVASILGEGPITRGLTVTTFHSLCVRLLRRYVELWADDASRSGKGAVPIKPDFTVFDADDQSSLMKKVLVALDLSTTNWPPRSVLSAVSNAKNDLIDHVAFSRAAGDFQTRTVARIYERYDAALRTAGAVDFDDLLLMTAKMLRESPSVRQEVRRRYRYLLIDEYQDTNKSQFVIASLIAGEEGAGGADQPADHDPAAAFTVIPRAVPAKVAPNICVVGDPDQSIYGWRGADIANILQFEEHYPSAKVIALGENFRSVEPIIAAADRLIRRNKRRKHKPLIAVRKSGKVTPETGVQIILCRDEHHEAALVLDWLQARHQEGLIEWKDAAIFYRTNALSRVIEDTLRNAGIPYTLVRGTAFYQREEIKNALAYLRVVANPADSVSLDRIINTPSRGIGDSSWEKVESAAAQRGITGVEMLRSAKELTGIPTRSLNAIAKFVATLDGWSPRGGPVPVAPEEESPEAHIFSDLPVEAAPDAPAPIGGLAELVGRVVKESGLELMYQTEEERVENLAELVSSAREFEEGFTGEAMADAAPGDPAAEAMAAAGGMTLQNLLLAYLERVALVADTDALDPSRGGGGAVTLMTLHAAKGLEYKAVALMGLEESMLPHSRSATSEDAEEEERRLCFVGVTRAMDRLMLTSARYRTLRGIPERMIPSRFIDELRGDGVYISDQAGSGLDDFDDGPDDVRGFIARGRPGAGSGGSGGGNRPGARPERRVESDDWGSESGGGRGGANSPFPVGSKVMHPQFGLGTVEAVTPGNDARVRIKFRDVGVKTLVLAYARLQKVQTS